MRMRRAFEAFRYWRVSAVLADRNLVISTYLSKGMNQNGSFVCAFYTHPHDAGEENKIYD